MILVGEIFNLSSGTSVITGIKKKQFHFKIPVYMDVYVNNNFYSKLLIEGLVLGTKNQIDNPIFEIITVNVSTILDKNIFNNQNNIILIPSVSPVKEESV
ncbi:MAG TPA: hypothetical protein VJY62_00320 [Bacteroidia bacterium]|nr:hypothetical protein [Bacteroidia bacterium]